MGRLTELDRRLADAPEGVRAQAEVLTDQISALLEQADADEVWAEQIGPAYTAVQVATLLGVTRQAVGQRRGLLALPQRDGRTLYPVFQFEGSGVLPGIQQVVRDLSPAVETTWTIASWLTSPHPDLGGRPLDALLHGNVTAVVNAARQFAAALAR